MNILLPSLYSGPAEYFCLIAKADDVVIEKWEYFEKQTLRNRCYISAANGVLPLIIPVKHGRKEKTLMKDVRICNDFNWQKIHWKSIESAYRSAPYFEFYEDDVAVFYQRKFSFLFDFNEELMHTLMHLLPIQKQIHYTDSYSKDYLAENDFRLKFNNKREMLLPAAFAPVKSYPQVFESKFGFIPNLSVMDLLFNVGTDAVSRLT